MKPPTLSLKALVAASLLCVSLAVSANDLISAEAASVIHSTVGRSGGAKGKQLATLQSYLLTDAVTVGLDPSDGPNWKTEGIDRAIKVWSNALSDSPFQLVARGKKPMVIVRFVDDIESDGDIQGQVEATRSLHWGSSVGYRIEATLLVRRTSGRHELDEDEITQVVSHELGHLLGLDDAEQCVGLMGPFVPGHPRLKPSKDEIGAVVEYRQQLRDAIAKLENR